MAILVLFMSKEEVFIGANRAVCYSKDCLTSLFRNAGGLRQFRKMVRRVMRLGTSMDWLIDYLSS